AAEAKTLRAVQACCAPTALFNGHPVPTDPTHFIQTLDPALKPYFLSNVLQFMVNTLHEDEHTGVYGIAMYHRTSQGVGTLRFQLTLALLHPSTSWQITSLDTPPQDSS